MTITIDIDDTTFAAIAEHVAGLRKPPRPLPDGSVISEPMFRGPEEYIEQILAQNFMRVLESNPTPAMLQARQKLEQAQQEMLAAAKPSVRAAKEAQSAK